MLQTALTFAFSVVGLLALAGGVMYILGRKLPAQHVAQASVRLPVTMAAVFDLLADAKGHVRWADGVTRVEQLEDRNGRSAYMQRMGRNRFVLVTTASEPPTLLVRTIEDDDGPFTGRWIYDLEPIDPPPSMADAAPGSHTRLTLTEEGTIRSAIPRAVLRYLFSYDMYIKRHLVSVARQFPLMPRD